MLESSLELLHHLFLIVSVYQNLPFLYLLITKFYIRLEVLSTPNFRLYGLRKEVGKGGMRGYNSEMIEKIYPPHFCGGLKRSL